MIFKIVKIERKVTASGKPMARLNLQNPENVFINDVTIWGDYPNFATLDVGHTTEGEIQEKQNGQYVNKTLYPERTNTLGAKRGGANMTKVMETKNENIKEAQNRKDESIKLASIQRDSVLLVTTFYPEANALYEGDVIGKETYIKERIMEWKKWLEQYYGDGKPF